MPQQVFKLKGNDSLKRFPPYAKRSARYDITKEDTPIEEICITNRGRNFRLQERIVKQPMAQTVSVGIYKVSIGKDPLAIRMTLKVGFDSLHFILFPNVILIR